MKNCWFLSRKTCVWLLRNRWSLVFTNRDDFWDLLQFWEFVYFLPVFWNVKDIEEIGNMKGRRMTVSLSLSNWECPSIDSFPRQSPPPLFIADHSIHPIPMPLPDLILAMPNTSFWRFGGNWWTFHSENCWPLFGGSRWEGGDKHKSLYPPKPGMSLSIPCPPSFHFSRPELGN